MKQLVNTLQKREALYFYIDKQLDSYRQSKVALVIIKVQNLKNLEVNVGFQSLELVSKNILVRLMSLSNNCQYVLQVALDEFILIIPKVLNNGHLKIIANRLSSKIQSNLNINNDVLKLVPSIGIASSLTSQNNAKDLYLNALIALQKGIDSSSQKTIYQAGDADQINKIWDLKKNIDIALINYEFELYFQPKVNTHNMRVTGAEALIRWNHPKYGMISPLEFIPVAEQSGQIHAITNWVIKSAIQQLAKIIKIFPEFQLSVNVSAIDLKSDDLILLLEDSLSIWSVPPHLLTIEVTETTIINDTELFLEQLNKIREIGMGVSIDDFGTGYSSLAYFKQIPATELKIDKSFIDNLLSCKKDLHIVSLIIFLSKKFNLKIVAEGVETKEILDEVIKLQCDYVQGYYFSKPLKYKDFINWVKCFN